MRSNAGTLNFDPTTILITLADGRTFQAERAGEDTSRGLALVAQENALTPVEALRRVPLERLFTVGANLDPAAAGPPPVE